MNISAVIPAYNEEGRIGNILSVLTDSPLIKEIIVINDGSTDGTEKEARQYPVTVINLPSNQGKSAAMKRGLEESRGEWILFLDADLRGLQKEHLLSIFKYTKKQDVDMVIGVFKKGKFMTDLSHRIAPFLSGQRLIKRTILNQIPFLEDGRYGIELIITEYTRRMNCKIKKVNMSHVYHVPKEKKRGWFKGKLEKYIMYGNILAVFFDLYCISKLKWMKKTS